MKKLLYIIIPTFLITFFFGIYCGIKAGAPQHNIEIYTCEDIYLISHHTVTSERGIYRMFRSNREVREYISSQTARDVKKCAGTFH